jgi:hypothetical protein
MAVTKAEEQTRINTIRALLRLPKPVSKAESELSYNRISHIRKETLEHLEKSSIGVKVIGLIIVKYIYYTIVKA